MTRIETSISADPLDVDSAIACAATEAAGGIGVFVGTVRTTPAVEGNAGKRVVALDYEAHPTLADQAIADIAASVARRFDLLTIVARHRSGHCPLGEPTVVVACGAAHRAEALEACRAAIDEIKHGVPIWKKEVYDDGSAWVGQGG